MLRRTENITVRIRLITIGEEGGVFIEEQHESEGLLLNGLEGKRGLISGAKN